MGLGGPVHESIHHGLRSCRRHRDRRRRGAQQRAGFGSESLQQLDRRTLGNIGKPPDQLERRPKAERAGSAFRALSASASIAVVVGLINEVA